MPAHVERFVARAHERGADGVILDLEDAVPLTDKPGARMALSRAVASLATHGTTALVRVNHGLRDLAHDLEAAVVPGLACLVLPKVDDPGYVCLVADAVAELEAERGIAPGTVRLLPQIETPAALFALPAIAGSHPRVAALALGPEDLSAAMGGAPVEALLLGPAVAVAAAARAAGILPLGFAGSIGNFTDPGAYRARIVQARQLGFAGALAVHPAQVAILNEGFAPTAAEVAWARRVADAAARAGEGAAFAVNGKMVDAPVVRRARDILAQA